ncbi:MAG: NADH-quinone oxidoreductase subunit I [Verrucomicrobiota bacterium]|nr:NADH-quinone oxidoreductase subunit I [Verrucomicrobiota bacterium]
MSVVARPNLKWFEKLYIPVILSGMRITVGHFVKTFLTNLGIRKTDKLHPYLEMSKTGSVTMQYPEEQWTMPEGYRGAPALIKDEEGREKCVSCQLCEFICPPRAIKIWPNEIETNVEKAPKEFKIDMLRCIYCGLCEEVCPEEAIFLLKEYVFTGQTRAELMHDKEKLYEMGGTIARPIMKWKDK